MSCRLPSYSVELKFSYFIKQNHCTQYFGVLSNSLYSPHDKCEVKISTDYQCGRNVSFYLKCLVLQSHISNIFSLHLLPFKRTPYLIFNALHLSICEHIAVYLYTVRPLGVIRFILLQLYQYYVTIVFKSMLPITVKRSLQCTSIQYMCSTIIVKHTV